MSLSQQDSFDDGRDYIVLIPLEKTSTLNLVSIERRKNVDTGDRNILHIGGGIHRDLIIYKSAQTGVVDNDPVHYSTRFKVFVTDQKSKQMQQENRTLRFWFVDKKQNNDLGQSEEFLRRLLNVDEFPRDYLSFIKRLMELLRIFSNIRKIQLEIQTLPDPATTENDHPTYKKNPQRYGDLIKERLLDLLEQAFPNPMLVNDLAKYVECDDQMIYESLIELEHQNLVKHLDHDNQQWIRVIISREEEQTHQVILYKSISEISNSFHPIIAIITVNYFEKLAVDAMIENKITFVRHKAGESNVYTIGTIGSHHVVSTKLPLIGRSRTAQISTGSTTTRLLGTFQHVQHVFIVGCAGGIAHYTDANRHIRRGDVIVAYPNEEDYVYGIYEAEQSDEGYEFVSTCYKPKSFELYHLLQSIKDNYEQTNQDRLANHKYPWEKFLEEGIQYLLSHNIDCLPPMSDRLFMKMDNGEMVEVQHPATDSRDHLKPTIRFGMIAGGKNLINNDYFKSTLNEKCHVLCFDTEIDQVLAAIQGNRIESFMVIRGISDYHDGTLNKEWQPFSALCAAAFLKTILYKIPKNQRSVDESDETV